MSRRFFLLAFVVSITHAALPPGGYPLPDVPVSMLGGKKLDLKQYRGKAVVLALVSTECAECANTVDLLKKIQDENRAQGLQVVVAAGDDDASTAIIPFTQMHKPNFPLGYLDRESFIKMASLKPSDRPFVPILMFIDPKGTVKVKLMGDDPLMRKSEPTIRGTVRELLKEPGIAPAK